MRHKKMLWFMARASEQALQVPELAWLGSVIRVQRQELGLSQEALADLAGLDRSYMGGVERGEHNIAFINLLKVSNALGLTLSELLARSGL
jgi:transcriptional regulator with XRE-family HTH domain